MNQVRTFHPISVVSVSESYNKLQAHLQQVVDTNTTYPVKKASNNKVDSLFNDADFGEGQTFSSSETRNAWINVPEGTTVQDLEALLANAPNAVIYRELSSQPILTDSDMSAIASGLTTKRKIAERQLVRNSNTKEVVTKDGAHFFRATFFSATGRPDIDNRGVDSLYQFAGVDMETGEEVPENQSSTSMVEELIGG